MVDIDKAVIARLRKKGKDFEIYVDCDKAIEYRAGKAKLEEALATSDIYSDVKQDMKASEEDMLDAFGTANNGEVAASIIKDGEIQLTTEHRNKLREEMRKRVINLIQRNAIDSKTNLPHPAERIERAIEQKRVRIDEFKPAEQQLPEVARQINDLLPLKFEIRELAVKIPAEFAAKAFGTLKSLGKMLSSEWQSDGSLVALVEVPAGMQPEFEDQVNKMARGNVDIKVVKRR